MARQRNHRGPEYQRLHDEFPISNHGHHTKESKDKNKSRLGDDFSNICVLLFLYILQGIPLGLISAVPYLLTNRGVSYAQQATFSFVTWPFSVKLLWAPFVDSIYSERFGRRKSWLVPIQYLIGAAMIVISYYVDGLMNSPEGPNMGLLTIIFLFLNFLAATQDIAVDGWALTMLKPANVGYASTCNTVGQTAGYFLGNVVFLALESKDFANNFLRSTPQDVGIVNLPQFFYFWGFVFAIATTLVALFKGETKGENSSPEDNMTLRETYGKLVGMIKMPAIRQFAVILLTCKVGFAVTDAATGLKLIEAGFHKENLALMAIPLVPLQIILPWIISRYTNGPRPLDVFMKAYPYRLMFGVIFCGVVAWTRNLTAASVDGTLPSYYYVITLLIYVVHQITLYCMFVAIMSFHAKISDPSIGGTYMTFLNTITNLGGNWPATVSLYFIDYFTKASCSTDGSSCKFGSKTDACAVAKGDCSVVIDGYYLESAICVVLGFFWLLWGKKRILNLQSKSFKEWKFE